MERMFTVLNTTAHTYLTFSLFLCVVCTVSLCTALGLLYDIPGVC